MGRWRRKRNGLGYVGTRRMVEHFLREAAEEGTLFWRTMVFGGEKGETPTCLAFSEVSKTLFGKKSQKWGSLTVYTPGAPATNPIVQMIYAQLKFLYHWSCRLRKPKPRWLADQVSGKIHLVVQRCLFLVYSYQGNDEKLLLIPLLRTLTPSFLLKVLHPHQSPWGSGFTWELWKGNSNHSVSLTSSVVEY